MKLAIMQPYFFPYIGYFQLINAVDKFIFYDDVDFIKGGWINRNYIRNKNGKVLITIPLKSLSSNKHINETVVLGEKKKILKTIAQNYSRAPYFEDVFPIVERTINIIEDSLPISIIAGESIINTVAYLKLKTQIEYSSEIYSDTVNLSRKERIFRLCERNKSKIYINSPGGRALYNKSDFQERGINLFFIKTDSFSYKQFGTNFIPNLSIIDIMMFNSKEEIKEMLNHYSLE